MQLKNKKTQPLKLSLTVTFKLPLSFSYFSLNRGKHQPFIEPPPLPSHVGKEWDIGLNIVL